MGCAAKGSHVDVIFRFGIERALCQFHSLSIHFFPLIQSSFPSQIQSLFLVLFSIVPRCQWALKPSAVLLHPCFAISKLVLRLLFTCFLTSGRTIPLLGFVLCPSDPCIFCVARSESRSVWLVHHSEGKHHRNTLDKRQRLLYRSRILPTTEFSIHQPTVSRLLAQDNNSLCPASLLLTLAHLPHRPLHLVAALRSLS